MAAASTRMTPAAMPTSTAERTVRPVIQIERDPTCATIAASTPAAASITIQGCGHPDEGSASRERADDEESRPGKRS